MGHHGQGWARPKVEPGSSFDLHPGAQGFGLSHYSPGILTGSYTGNGTEWIGAGTYMG